MFLCEVAANQLQQSKRCYVSHVLRFMQRIKSRTGIRAIGYSRTRSRALKGEIVTTEQIQLGIEVKVQL